MVPETAFEHRTRKNISWKCDTMINKRKNRALQGVTAVSINAIEQGVWRARG